jgi:hypothetical protein
MKRRNNMKERITMLEKMSTVSNAIELAMFNDGTFDSSYLELGKVYYVTLAYTSDELKEQFLGELPKVKDSEGEDTDVVDIFGAYNYIMEDSSAWDGIIKSQDANKLMRMIDTRYEEVKLELLNKSNFENRILGIVEELKVKLIETMDGMDIDKLQEMATNVPAMLEGLTDGQKGLLDNVVKFGKQEGK